jgi:hypothetical protein
LLVLVVHCEPGVRVRPASREYGAVGQHDDAGPALGSFLGPGVVLLGPAQRSLDFFAVAEAGVHLGLAAGEFGEHAGRGGVLGGHGALPEHV